MLADVDHRPCVGLGTQCEAATKAAFHVFTFLKHFIALASIQSSNMFHLIQVLDSAQPGHSLHFFIL